jgi:glycosyltransferase involved in cell wall biosynthesis
MIEYPLVSVIITSYNRQDLISKTIESVISQNYNNLEIIIIDNCSTDQSDGIIQSYARNYPNIVYLKNDNNLGFVKSLFKAINFSKGEYFTHVSSDDYLIKDNFIKEAIEKSFEIRNAVIICANVSYLIESTGIVTPCILREKYNNFFFNQPFVDGKKVFLEFTKCFPITMGACVIKRNSFIKLNIDKVAPIHSDIEMILQLSLLGNIIFLDYEAYVVRLHGNNISHSLIPVSENVENFSFIEVPYKFAKKIKCFEDEKILEDWKFKMLYNFVNENLTKYYKNDKQQYKIFKSYIKKFYPVIYNKIRFDTKWIINLLVFKYIGIVKMAIKLRAFFKN